MSKITRNFSNITPITGTCGPGGKLTPPTQEAVRAGHTLKGPQRRQTPVLPFSHHQSSVGMTRLFQTDPLKRRLSPEQENARALATRVLEAYLNMVALA